MSTDPTTKPYLIRAIRDWALDQGFTPHILVDASHEGVQVPTQHIEDGKIVLNVSSNAVKNIELNNEWILFSARFSGVSQNIDVPIAAVLAVFARENGQGLFFQQTESSAPMDNPDNSDKPETIAHATDKQDSPSALEAKMDAATKQTKSEQSAKRAHLKLVE